MLKNMPSKDFRTPGIVLRRTNYGEADRILNIITPGGKLTAIAKGARREKSKLAGGIEMFSLVDLNLHQGKSEFAIVTGARLIKYYGNIIKDLESMEFAAEVLKRINKAAESSDNPDYFDIMNQVCDGLDRGLGLALVRIWFYFNIIRASGEEINLYRDTYGNKLDNRQCYDWDYMERGLVPSEHGEITADEIKAMRLMLTAKLLVVSKIKNIGEMLPPILKVAQGI